MQPTSQSPTDRNVGCGWSVGTCAHCAHCHAPGAGCGPGEYRAAGSEVCANCEADCDAGQFCARHGAAQGCHNCTEDDFDHDFDPLTPCVACAAGKSAAVGATECTEVDLDAAEDALGRLAGALEGLGVVGGAVMAVCGAVWWLCRCCPEEESQAVQDRKYERLQADQDIEANVARMMSRQLRPDGCFTGRNSELEQLRRQLLGTGSGRASLTGDPGGRRESIVQYGGAGKTTLMRKFARDHRSEYPGGVFWVDADGAERLRSSFLRLVRDLGGEANDEAEHESVAAAAQVALNARSPSQWLLCIDNADDEEVLDLLQLHYLPGQLRGSVLVTSRC